VTSNASPRLDDLTEQPTAVIRGEVQMDQLPAFFDRSFGELATVLADQGIEPRSAAFAKYDGAPTDVARLEVGFVVDAPVQATGDVAPGTLPGGRVATVLHHGGFDGLGASWGALFAWVAEQGLTPGELMWEVYLTEPTPDMDPAELRTELVLTLA
jgi:effector-binding domain-containing protein